MHPINHPIRILKILALSIMILNAGIFIDAHAIGYLERLHCDYVFSESHFRDINRKDYPRCEKRWYYLIARIMKYHP